MNELINMSVGDAGMTAILGYLVVFSGLVLLMFVVMLVGKVMTSKAKAEPVPAAPSVEKTPEPAPGAAGELKLYDTDPRDAAMIMAIVADALGKPINELRFISIKEVKDDEV